MDTTSIIGGPVDRTIQSLVLWDDRYFCRSEGAPDADRHHKQYEAVEVIDGSTWSRDRREIDR
jgi:hypothetical protein